jgi:hypothetical protein
MLVVLKSGQVEEEQRAGRNVTGSHPGPGKPVFRTPRPMDRRRFFLRKPIFR